MTPSLKLKQFEGPLDLLLQLVDEQKLNITELALSEVTEQYLNYLQQLDDRFEELADFLVVATRLLYLKSRLLLPYLYPAEEESQPSLAEQLRLYRRFVEASKVINKRWQENLCAYGRIEPPLPPNAFVFPANAYAPQLEGAFREVLKRLRPVDPIPKIVIDRTVTVRDKVAAIYEALRRIKRLEFSQLLDGANSRSEVIISFLAVLELMKQDKIYIEQTASFDAFSISLS